MRLFCIGMGKMGRAVTELAGEFGHHMVDTMSEADVCIEFTAPERVVANIESAASAGKHLVVGTTGWYDQLDHVKAVVQEADIGLIYGANFSVGVTLFKQLLAQAASLMEAFPEYEGVGFEVHHSAKLDAPSGTAHELGEITGLPFSSVRVGRVPGTHTVMYDSEADTLELTHRARSRCGFALGALRAAEWIEKRKGVYTFEEMVCSVAQ